MRSYRTDYIKYNNLNSLITDPEIQKAFLHRAKVLRKALSIMKKAPEKDFTQKQWNVKSFDKIRELE